MRKLEDFSAWYPQFLIGIAVAACLLYLGFFHVLLKIPLRALLAPWLGVSLLLALAGPILYWSLKYGHRSGGDLRPFFAVICVLMMVSAPVILYYASRVGIMTAEVARGSSIAVLIAMPPCTLAAYCVSRKFLR